MKRFCLLVVSIILFSFVLFGCANNEDSYNEISKVSMSNSYGFGVVNTDFFIVYEDEATLKTFQNAISKAVKLEGIVDMATPEFDVEVIYVDGSKEAYHLWVGETGEKSSIMKVEDTHTVYFIPEEITDQFIELVDKD